MSKKPEFKSVKEEKEYLIEKLLQQVPVNISQMYPSLTSNVNTIFTNIEDVEPETLAYYGFDEREVGILLDHSIPADNIDKVAPSDYERELMAKEKARKERRKELIKQLLEKTSHIGERPKGVEDLDNMIVDFDPVELRITYGFTREEVNILLDHNGVKFPSPVYYVRKVTVDRNKLSHDLKIVTEQSPIVVVALNDGTYYILKDRYKPELEGDRLTSAAFSEYTTQARGFISTFPERFVKSAVEYSEQPLDKEFMRKEVAKSFEEVGTLEAFFNDAADVEKENEYLRKLGFNIPDHEMPENLPGEYDGDTIPTKNEEGQGEDNDK